MRIGDLPPPIMTYDIPQWDNGDRALLRELKYLNSGLPLNLQTVDLSNPGTQYLIDQLKSDVDKFSKYLLNLLLPQLPPESQQKLQELLADLENALSTLQNPPLSPEEQKAVADRVDNDQTEFYNMVTTPYS